MGKHIQIQVTYLWLQYTLTHNQKKKTTNYIPQIHVHLELAQFNNKSNWYQSIWSTRNICNV